MAVVLLVRHAQASFGGEDYDILSPVGERQAGVVGARLARLGVDRILHGALRRQEHTAQVIAREVGRGLECTADACWDEYDHEDILAASLPTAADREALDRRLAAAEDPRRAFQEHFDTAVARWTRGADDATYAEPYGAFVARVTGALDALVGRLGRSETTVVVTSGGVISAVCARLLGLDDAAWAGLNRVIVNTAITKLVHGRSGTTLLSINDHAHLEDEPRELLTYR